MVIPDLVGKRFGKLTVIEKLKANSHGEMTWLCVCDCGNTKVTTSNKLTHGYTIQCKRCKHYVAGEHIKRHGLTSSKLWNTYYGMKYRCNDPKCPLFYRYGGRGIKMCEEWEKSFVAFANWAQANGFDDKLTLDRVDNDGNYCPENCRWATVTEQANNRSTNRMVTVNGVSDTLANWVRKTNATYGYVRDKLDAGADPNTVIGYLIESGDTHVRF